MRDYISKRLLVLEHFKISDLPEPPSVPQFGVSPGNQPLESTHTNAPPHKTAGDETADSADELAVDRDVAASPLPPLLSGSTDVPGQADESAPPAPPLPGGETRNGDGERHPQSLGVPVPDGQGGLSLPPMANGELVSVQRHDMDLAEPAGRREFPHPDENEPAQALAPGASSGGGGRAGFSLKLEDPAERRSLPLPYLLLPEIGKLAKEMVRNGEEKVAVAVGAYNSVRVRMLNRTCFHNNYFITRTTTTTSSCPGDAFASRHCAFADLPDRPTHPRPRLGAVRTGSLHLARSPSLDSPLFGSRRGHAPQHG
jgi:hypothetical protein